MTNVFNFEFMSIKKYLPILIIILIIASIIGGVWFLTKDDDLSDKLSKLNIYSEEELSFLEKEGFFYDIDSENLPDNKEDIAYLFKSSSLIEQNLNSPDESFEVLATKLNKSNKSYQLAFKLENKSNESKEFYLIPISEKDQLQFKEIKGLVNNTNLLFINKDDVQKQPLETLYDVKQHKQELRIELGQAYKDIETNNYKAEPIKIVLASKSTVIAQSLWDIINESDDLRPVYFLVYGSAAGAKEELTILNVHSHPAQGENWEVEFTTRGMADLKIIPADQATIDDDEFKGLFCDDEERFPQILQGDVIYYPNWQCSGIGEVVHYTLTAGNHKLRFEFNDQIVYAYNDAETQVPTGQVTWTNLDGSYADVDDDPDSPDENWGDVSANNVDTVAHVSFPTPSGNLTQGANLQEFKVWIKKWNGTGTPQCRIDLYEGGALVTSGVLTNVTSTTGELKSFTWDASALTNADGSGVEAYVFGDAVGGAPAARVSVSVGAVEWNVDYSTNATPEITSAKDGPDPIEVGQDITFYVDWSDGDGGELVKIHICKENGITVQTCDGTGSWCDSADPTTNDPETCNYTIQSGDTGTKDYFAFVCDDDDACSSSTPGTFTASAVTPTSLKFDGGIKFEGGIIIK